MAGHLDIAVSPDQDDIQDDDQDDDLIMLIRMKRTCNGKRDGDLRGLVKSMESTIAVTMERGEARWGPW